VRGLHCSCQHLAAGPGDVLGRMSLVGIRLYFSLEKMGHGGDANHFYAAEASVTVKKASKRVEWKENMREQNCLDCAADLVCVADEIVGGSHYYYFKCPVCNERFNLSTYDFTLRHAAKKTWGSYDPFIDTLRHHFVR